MPAKNKRQQRLFGMALALERGKMPKSKASKKVKAISKGMSEEEIEKFAKTKHKGLKENRARSFSDFLNEAYIDQEGNLRDFEFTPEEQHKLTAFDHVMALAEFLESLGAKYMVPDLSDDGIATFKFKYRGEPYMITIDLDNDVANFEHTGFEVIPIFRGSADSLFSMLAANGFDYL